LERAHWRQFPLALCERCSGILLTYSTLAALRIAWAQMPRRSPEFELRVPEAIPEGFDDPAAMLLWAVFHAL